MTKAREEARPRTVEQYLELPYTVRITPEPHGGYVGVVEELPGCITQGESWAEVGEMLRDAMAAWISVALGCRTQTRCACRKRAAAMIGSVIRVAPSSARSHAALPTKGSPSGAESDPRAPCGPSSGPGEQGSSGPCRQGC